MAEEIKKLFQDYREGKLSRREFMRRAILVTGSLAAANSIIESLVPSGADAAVVSPDDSEILTHNVQFKGKTTSLSGYLARPVKAGRYPALIVIPLLYRLFMSRSHLARGRAPAAGEVQQSEA